MGTQFDALEATHKKFIAKQLVFFVGSAASTGLINVSPKGMDSLRVLGPKRILWRNMTGSGNETATHVSESPRMTLMWCAFEGPPTILRAYGTACPIFRNDPDWTEYDAHFETDPAARQLFDFNIDMVQKSCGYAVPQMDFKAERNTLKDWAARKGEDGIHEYWATRNAKTLDGVETGIVARNLDF